MAGIKFIQYTDSKTLARDSQAVLGKQRSVFISAHMKWDRVAFSMTDGGHSGTMVFTAEQARVVAAELLACADACGALRTANHSLEG